jgi:hypothetical protein
VLDVFALDTPPGREVFMSKAVIIKNAQLAERDPEIAPARIFLHCAEHIDSPAAMLIYLHLTIRRSLPLANLDHELRKIAKRLGVSLLG